MAELSNNKRIAKNTLLLYARMLYSLFLSLFTARVILNALGFEDYGLYNVIGSIVSMFIFLRSAMGNSTNRYLTYSIGKGNFDEIKKTFSLSIIIFTGLALLIVVLCETVGLWFFYEKMNIPENRMTAAFWVYQFSIITTALSVICVPYDAIIIAHEKMNVFAYVQILNATLNLGIVYLVAAYPYDRLIFYAFLLMLVQVMNRVIYGVYCGRHFPETKFRFIKDWSLIKEMTSFAGWSLFGNLAYVVQNHGLNILINMFFNPVVNSARAVAFQVQNAIKGFVVNFQTASFPQITKSYAADDRHRMFGLIFFVSKFSFCLLLCMGLPIFLEADTILTLWLKAYPPHTINFLRIILLISMIESLSNPLATAIAATGKIKTYQIILSVIDLMILPFAYVALKLGCEAEIVFIIQLCLLCIEQLTRILLCKKKIELPFWLYLDKVIKRTFFVTILSVLIPALLYFYLNSGIIRVLIVCVASVISVGIATFLVGLDANERKVVLGFISNIFKRKKK